MRLAGKRVLVTRAAGQSSALAEMLEAEGAIVVRVPTIEIGPPDSWCGLDAALISVRSFDWVVFTSANAVLAFVARARVLKVPAFARRVAVVGPATGRAVVESGLGSVDLMPGVFTGEGLAGALEGVAAGSSVLLVRAAVAGDVVRERLEGVGAVVTVAEAYRNRVPEGAVGELAGVFAAGVDAITFTSASTARNLAGLVGTVPEGVVMASIGPVTSGAMRELGMRVDVEAGESTVGGLVEAVVKGLGMAPAE